MSDLPYEITENILLRIPARSLLRFKLVCRLWRSLISDPSFIKNHANHAVLDQENRRQKVITHWTTSQEEDSWRHSVISQSADYESFSFTNFELKIGIQMVSTILSSCNGLLLISIRGIISSTWDSPILWNPLVEKFKILPKSNFASSSYDTRLVGFGYVASTDDYKVVRLSRSKSNGYPRCFSEQKAEIYSLKTDSWKIISGFPTSIWTSYGTHVHGSIYWILHDEYKRTVTAFDLITEKFKLINTPIEDNFQLMQIRGCLGAYQHRYCYDEIVTWMWNEDENKKGYWTKLVTIPVRCQTNVLGLLLMNDNEVLLHVNHEGSRKLVIYDFASMIFRDHILHGNLKKPVLMVETLVSAVSSDDELTTVLENTRYGKRKR